METETGDEIRLLVADDSEINRIVTRQFLEGYGYVVDEAADGDEAVRRFRERPYAVVFLDVRMAGTDGLAAARAMRRWEETTGRAPAPILAVTAGNDVADEEAAREAGCQALLRRPLGPEVLRAAVELLTGDGKSDDLVAAAAMMRPPQPEPRLAHLLPRLLARLEQEAAAMAERVAAGDFPAVAELAHKGRGECSVFGIIGLERALEELEAAAASGDVAETGRRLARYRALLRWHEKAGEITS